MEIEGYMSIWDASQSLGIKPKTINAQIQKGKIQVVVFYGKRLIHEDEIERYRNASLGKPGAKTRR